MPGTVYAKPIPKLPISRISGKTTNKEEPMPMPRPMPRLPVPKVFRKTAVGIAKGKSP